MNCPDNAHARRVDADSRPHGARRYFPQAAVTAAAAAVACATAGPAHAAGFALIEHSAAGLGNAFAGGSAEAGDLSVIWFNPAGMTRFDGMQVQLAAHLVSAEFEYDDDGSTQASPFGPLPAIGRTDVDGGIPALVPANYVSYAVNDRLNVGLGLNVPFGLKTKYDEDWVGRHQAVKSEITTINVNPSIAFEIVPDTLSIGVGVSAMYMNAELSNSLNYTAICSVAPVCAGLQPDGFLTLKANDWGFGFNAGVLYQLSPDTRFGIQYRSRVEQELEGGARSVGTIPGQFTGPIKVDVDLPASASVSAFHRFHEQWAIMGDATWTEWSTIEELRVNFTSPTPLSGTSLVEPLEWEDSWRLALGLNYYHNDKWTWRFGAAWDQGPTPGSELRTARLPDNDRIWASAGVGYKWSDDVQIDAGYAHLFINGTKINRTNTTGLNLNGNFNSSADVLGVQARIRMH